MAEGTYEYECMRSELLGIEKPNEQEFEKARAERLEQEKAEGEAAEAQMLEEQEEQLKVAGGKLDELNSILSTTQQKLNRFKQNACGSLSNIFNKGSVDVPDGNSASPSTSATASRRNTTACGYNEPVVPEPITAERISAAKIESQKKMTSQLDKLDSLISKAENAEISMQHQNKQMKKMAK